MRHRVVTLLVLVSIGTALAMKNYSGAVSVSRNCLNNCLSEAS
jgi:hypothetical protein